MKGLTVISSLDFVTEVVFGVRRSARIVFDIHQRPNSGCYTRNIYIYILCAIYLVILNGTHYFVLVIMNKQYTLINSVHYVLRCILSTRVLYTVCYYSWPYRRAWISHDNLATAQLSCTARRRACAGIRHQNILYYSMVYCIIAWYIVL